jgi:nucleotide-binding universal stress UspA family protein
MIGGAMRRIKTQNPRKFLVVIDDSPECERALAFAGYRAHSTGGAVLAVSIIEPSEFQHWMGVEAIMRAEAIEEAQARLNKASSLLSEMCGLKLETRILEGKTADELQKLIAEDDDISILILGAATGNDGAGPLVGMLASQASSFHVPVTVVPGTLSNEEINALT